MEQEVASLNMLGIDNAVVASNITPPSYSPFLNILDRVISRLLAKSKKATGLRDCLTEKRKAARSLLLQIFNAKNIGEEAALS